ncbi:hypothetical protein O1611_g7361 [Lasiodiplodia mahajangana]|uniref:Uncharacterized protein n=1 Tax=Lasiodiplodia mahajangana TaxID=1108764 RepID=A0ACC2JFI0_9PEZI|nr:hypothetical protein O1611_g7361 [Lasiodiplodia mahajangana]
MPEAERFPDQTGEVCQPDIPDNFRLDPAADRVENQPQCPITSSTVGDWDKDQSQPSLDAENGPEHDTCSRLTYGASIAFTCNAAADHSPTYGPRSLSSDFAAYSSEPLGSNNHHSQTELRDNRDEPAALRYYGAGNISTMEIEVPRSSQLQIELNRLLNGWWVDIFNIEENIVSTFPGMSNEDLCSFSLIYKESTNDKDIELRIFIYFLLFYRTKSQEYLQQAIRLTGEWDATLTVDQPDCARRRQIGHLILSWKISMEEGMGYDRLFLVETYNERARAFESYRQTDNLDDLRDAISIMERIVNENRMSIALVNLAIMLEVLYDRSNSADDLIRAIELANMAVDIIPESHPNHLMCLDKLAHLLVSQYKKMGSVDSLNRAIDIYELLVEKAPQRHEHLINLGACLSLRFEREGSMNDLNRCIDLGRAANNLLPQDDSARGPYLLNLSNFLSARSRRTASTHDLNEAIDLLSAVVDSTPHYHPHYHPYRALSLKSLADCLKYRWGLESSLDDLTRAIDMANAAVNAMPQGHYDRPAVLSTLSDLLGYRFSRLGSSDDLNRAIDVAESAVDSSPLNHHSRSLHLLILAQWLFHRFARERGMDDMNRALSTAQLALQVSNSAICRAGSFHTLGQVLAHKFLETRSADDLNSAIDMATKATSSLPRGSPQWIGSLKYLGGYLKTRYRLGGSIDDFNDALSHFKEAWNCHIASSSTRISIAKLAADLLALRSNWKEASQLLKEAVYLLPTVSARSLKHTDKQDTLTGSAGLASFAAASILYETKGAGEDGAYEALKLLELGRNIIAGILMDIRMDVSDLEQKHPTLAAEFVSLRDELDSSAGQSTSWSLDEGATSWEARVKRRREVDQRFSDLITTIRTKPGFHNFLLPPTKDELMAAADQGPIIIVNLCSYRCDAFIIERHRIRVLGLPNLTPKRVRKHVLDLRSSRSANMAPVLKWLWETICHPCLDLLGFQGSTSIDDCPHIWWIPTGLLSQLPLHAAGCYQQGSTDTVIDRAISSYASSIKMLVHGRRRRIDNPTQVLSDQAVLVAMRTTPGLPNGDLPFAEKEVNTLEALCTSLQLKPAKPELRKEDVLKSLRDCKIFHFAGHGESHPTDPSESALLLEDWDTNGLTVGDLRDHRLQENPPFLGYLSACSTGSNMAEKLADEGIHLVGALQLAGFQHVVGTLWEVSDEHCLHVARVLYETLRDEGMTDISVRRGLHKAIKQLRDKEIEMEVQGRHTIVGNPKPDMMGFHWVPYIHFGA